MNKKKKNRPEATVWFPSSAIQGGEFLAVNTDVFRIIGKRSKEKSEEESLGKDWIPGVIDNCKGELSKLIEEALKDWEITPRFGISGFDEKSQKNIVVTYPTIVSINSTTSASKILELAGIVMDALSEHIAGHIVDNIKKRFGCEPKCELKDEVKENEDDRQI